MGYVEEHLDRDEQVVHRGALHPIVYVGPSVLALIGVGLLLVAFRSARGVAVLLSLILFVPLVVRVFEVRAAEFAVTTRRVIMKYGILQQHSLELLLQKIEGAKVEQDILGRALEFGTIIVNGTGGTHEPFKRLQAPMEFRRHVLAQIGARDKASSRASGVGTASAGPVAASSRLERACPHCAEPILEKAKVCKHCGRDVAPAA